MRAFIQPRLPLCRRPSCELARIDEERATRHQEREVAGTENDDPRDVVRDGNASEWKARAELAEGEAGRFERPALLFEARRQCHGRRDRKRTDAMCSELNRKALGQSSHTELRSDVMGDSGSVCPVGG